VFKTPYLAIVGQGIWASVLVLSGSYAQLVSFATFTFWIFYGMTVAGLIVLRRRLPNAPRPYRMSGYPVTAFIFVIVAVWVAAAAILSAPATSAIGILIVASGVPAYYLWRKHSTYATRDEALSEENAG
jgi:APA family basic amino acid/polyamine antiporter